MKLGVITDCFRRGLDESLALAASLGAEGVQIYAVSGEICPEKMTPASVAALRERLRENRLTLSALCGDLGGHGFEIAKENPARIEKTKAIIDLAAELGTHVVTTHVGVIRKESNDPIRRAMLEAITECGRYAVTKGVTLAIETGPEPACVLREFLRETEGGVGVNLDPANLVMVTGEDPVAAVRLLGAYIVHTHVKDGVMLKQTDPLIVYDSFARGGIEALNVADYFRETPVGEGNVDFPAYLEALREVGYDGFLTVERETGEDPAADIRLAFDRVRAWLA